MSRVSRSIIFTALILASATTRAAENATPTPTATPTVKKPGSSARQKAEQKKARKPKRPAAAVKKTEAPEGFATVLPPLNAPNRRTVAFLRATTPPGGGVAMRSLSTTEYAEYAAAADRESLEVARVEMKQIAPPLPVEKLEIDILEAQILASVKEVPPATVVAQPETAEVEITIAPAHHETLRASLDFKDPDLTETELDALDVELHTIPNEGNEPVTVEPFEEIESTP